ncbi:MAG: hypothetical protein U9R41_06815 [Candidatus Marinimicrobia bacterium]|nr:hypothetical protein [Candidatus Neomarinimicrobiota bacterium]
MKKLIVIMIIVIGTFAYSQEKKGIHQIEWEEHQKDTVRKN